MFSSRSDDEVGGSKARSARSRCSRRRSAGGADETSQDGADPTTRGFVGSDADGGSPADIASERSEPLDTANLASEAIKQ
jgi:hypothetical protein